MSTQTATDQSRPRTRLAALLAAVVVSVSLMGAGAIPATAHAEMNKHLANHLK